MLLARRLVIMSMGAAASSASGASASSTAVSAAAASTASGALDYSDAALRARLSPHAYSVTREKGTERAWTSELNNVKGPGEFRCVACGEILFTGDGKVRRRRQKNTFSPFSMLHFAAFSLRSHPSNQPCSLIAAAAGHHSFSLRKMASSQSTRTSPMAWCALRSLAPNASRTSATFLTTAHVK